MKASEISDDDKAIPHEEKFRELVKGLLDENADVDKSAQLINRHLAQFDLVCFNCGCPPPKGGERGVYCSACGAEVYYITNREFEDGSSQKRS